MACLFLPPTFGGCGILNQLLVSPKTGALQPGRVQRNPFYPCSCSCSKLPGLDEGERKMGLDLFSPYPCPLLSHSQVWMWVKGKWRWIPFLFVPAQPFPSLDTGKRQMGMDPFSLYPCSCSGTSRSGYREKANGDGSLFSLSLAPAQPFPSLDIGERPGMHREQLCPQQKPQPEV